MNWEAMLFGALFGGGVGYLIWDLPHALACACIMTAVAGDLAGYNR